MRQKYKISAVRPSQGALDFSYLLDAPAGKHGFVTAKHGHFYFEDGARARFIGFNLAARSNTPDHAHAEKLAERFASLGVNVIRLHAADAPISDEPRSWASCRETPLLDYDRGSGRFFHTEGLDRFDYLVAKLKEKGIYLHIDLIVARNFVSGDELSYPGDAGNCVKCYPMFNERMIELQQEYARELLTHVNPYTGLALVEDPAVMTVQINNEDSAIKGTMDSDWNPVMQPYRDEVRKRWNDFLLMKYSDREHLEKAWTWEGQCALKETEDPNAGTVEIVKVTAKVARKDADGKRVKEVVDGKKVTVYDEVEKEIKKDMPSRLHARRQMVKALYDVTEVPTAAAGKKKNTKKVDLTNKLFNEIAPKYASRNGGYTRIIKIGQRKGDGAMAVLIELV